MSERALPRPTPETQAYWDGLQVRELRLHRCAACNAVWLPTQNTCPDCGGADFSTLVSCGRGRLYSYVISHLAVPGFEPPTTIAIVELEEGPRLLTNLVGVGGEGEGQGGVERDHEPNPDALPIGLPVEVVFESVSDQITLPLFRPSRVPG